MRWLEESVRRSDGWDLSEKGYCNVLNLFFSEIDTEIEARVSQILGEPSGTKKLRVQGQGVQGPH
jgi:hypothetical protein